jgi:hypothetical protein
VESFPPSNILLFPGQYFSAGAEQAIAIFVHIGIGKVGKLFSAVGKKLPVLFQFLYRGM